MNRYYWIQNICCMVCHELYPSKPYRGPMNVEYSTRNTKEGEPMQGVPPKEADTLVIFTGAECPKCQCAHTCEFQLS